MHVYSELTDQQLKDSMLIPTSNIEHTIQELEHRYGRKLTIGVMPQGPLTIPYVEDNNKWRMETMTELNTKEMKLDALLKDMQSVVLPSQVE